MKLTDIINYPFPDNEGYRLVDIQKITKKGNVYKLLLSFQKVENARKRFNEDDLTLREFLPGVSVLRESNIAYARLFVIGSIWWNKEKPQVVLPEYLFRYSFSSKIIDFSKLTSCNTSEFSEKHSMAAQYIKDGILQTRHPKIICFELNETVFHHQKNEGAFPLLREMPDLPNPARTQFIAFHPYEIFRYFFTASNISDLNDRLCNRQFTSNLQNELYDIEKSKQDNGKHYIHLMKNYDLQDAHLLGNIAYYPLFRNTVRKIQNYLNSSGYFGFHTIDGLPVTSFESMDVTAVNVKRKSDGADGLLVLQIQSCKNYINHSYTPVIPVLDQENGGKPGTGTRGGGGTKGKPEGNEPKVNQDVTTTMGFDTVDLELLGLAKLFAPNQDVILDETLYKRVNRDGSISLFPTGSGDDTVYPPGSNPDGNGPRPKNKIEVERTNYFEFFPEIVRIVCDKIKEHHLAVDLSYISDDLLSYYESIIIDATKIKTITLLEGEPKWELYLAEIKVSGPDSNTRYYYLFEKYSETHTSSRTWLYSPSNFRSLGDKELIEAIKQYLFQQKNSSPQRLEPDNKFNHLQSEKVEVKDGIETYTSVKRDKALNKHIEKIANRILKVYSFRLPG